MSVSGTARAAGNRRPRRRVLATGLLAASLGLAAAAALFLALAGGGALLAPDAGVPNGSTATRGLASLPLAAQGQISAALGQDERGYRISGAASGGGLTGWNPSQKMRSSFTRSGVVVSSGGLHLGLALRAIGYGATLGRVAAASPEAAGNRVSYARPGVLEWYANGPFGLEQGFTILHAPPPGASGPLTLKLALSGEATATLARGAILFTHGRERIRYAGLSVTDAAGRLLPSRLGLGAGGPLIRIDARGAHYPLRVDPLIQQAKLGGGGEVGQADFGSAVAVSADGNTAVIGGPGDNSFRGAAWVFTRAGETWTQQGEKLTGGEEVEKGWFGASVALSSDGNTALIGGTEDASVGAVWVFKRSGGKWAQQGKKITAKGESGNGAFGYSVALSSEGNTALVGGWANNLQVGAAWVFTRAGETWTQQGELLLAAGETGAGAFGSSVALSSDGNTALIGAPDDNKDTGAVWYFKRVGALWSDTQKLTGLGSTGEGTFFGDAVALSGNGASALIGGEGDNKSLGAAWAFARSGEKWNQQGEKIRPTGESGTGDFGNVAMSSDGHTALIGAVGDNGRAGAAWVFTSGAEKWTQQGEKLTGSGAFGGAVALSSEGTTALVGGSEDNTFIGSAWVFAARPTVTSVTPAQGPEAGGTSVTIKGTHLGGATAVDFGATPAKSFEVISAESIKATAPAGQGTVDVRVTVPSGVSEVVVGDRYAYLPPEKVQEEEAAVEAAKGLPTITSAVPDAVLVTGGTVTLHGANYVGVKAVTFSGVSATEFAVESETTIRAVVPDVKIRKECQPTVMTEAGTSKARGDNAVECVPAGSGPTVTKVSPNKGPSGGGQTVTVTGTGFTGVTGVLLSGSRATQVVAASATSLTMVVPAHSEGTTDAVVSTPNGTSPIGSKDHYKYGKPATPTVSQLSPAAGPAAGGTTVTISGTNFSAGMSFAFKSASVSGVNCITTSCTVTTPAGKTGTVDVIAKNGKAKSKKNPPGDQYTYQ